MLALGFERLGLLKQTANLAGAVRSGAVLWRRNFTNRFVLVNKPAGVADCGSVNLVSIVTLNPKQGALTWMLSRKSR